MTFHRVSASSRLSSASVGKFSNFPGKVSKEGRNEAGFSAFISLGLINEQRAGGQRNLAPCRSHRARSGILLKLNFLPKTVKCTIKEQLTRFREFARTAERGAKEAARCQVKCSASGGKPMMNKGFFMLKENKPTSSHRAFERATAKSTVLVTENDRKIFRR